jgi:hypothetical protein
MEMITNLKDLTSNILETMFFLTQETEPQNSNKKYKYAVNIKDPRVDLIIMFSEKTAYTMTENFLGNDEITEQDIHDTLKESINIIAGNFMPKAFPDFGNKIFIPVMVKNISGIDIASYNSAMLYYREEPLNILLKVQ